MLILRVDTLGDSFRVRLSDWGLGLIMGMMGLILLMPFPTFTGANYELMARVAPEATWGGACIVIGFGRIVVLLVNGAWRRSPHLRMVLALLACFIWFQMTLSFLAAGLYSLGLAIFSVFVAMDVVSAYRAAIDARMSDDAAGKNART